MRIIDLVDEKLVISPEALCISPFSEIWANDKSKAKTVATDQIKYIWFFSDYNSPYYKHPEKDRHDILVNDVIKDKNFKITKEIKEGIQKYKELTTSPAVEAVEAAFAFMRKIQDYFKTVNLAEVNNPKAVTDIFANMPKMVSALNEAKKNAYAEETSGVKVRGQATLGLFEG